MHQIRRMPGEAGHVRYDVDLVTLDGRTRHFAFAGNIFVGPVVVTSKDEVGQWDHHVIDDPRRFGEFVSVEWVRRFLAAEMDERTTNTPQIQARSSGSPEWFGRSRSRG